MDKINDHLLELKLWSQTSEVLQQTKLNIEEILKIDPSLLDLTTLSSDEKKNLNKLEKNRKDSIYSIKQELKSNEKSIDTLKDEFIRAWWKFEKDNGNGTMIPSDIPNKEWKNYENDASIKWIDIMIESLEGKNWIVGIIQKLEDEINNLKEDLKEARGTKKRQSIIESIEKELKDKEKNLNDENNKLLLQKQLRVTKLAELADKDDKEIGSKIRALQDLYQSKNDLTELEWFFDESKDEFKRISAINKQLSTMRHDSQPNNYIREVGWTDTLVWKDIFFNKKPGSSDSMQDKSDKDLWYTVSSPSNGTKVEQDSGKTNRIISKSIDINWSSQKIRIEIPSLDKHDNEEIKSSDIKIYYDPGTKEVENSNYPIEFDIDIAYTHDDTLWESKSIYTDKKHITFKLEVPLAGDAIKKTKLDDTIKDPANTTAIQTEIKRQIEIFKDFGKHCRDTIDTLWYDEKTKQSYKNLISRLEWWANHNTELIAKIQETILDKENLMKALRKQDRVIEVFKDEKKVEDASKKIIKKAITQSDSNGQNFRKELLTSSSLFTDGLVSFLDSKSANLDDYNISENDIAEQEIPSISDLTTEIKINEHHYLKYDRKAGRYPIKKEWWKTFYPDAIPQKERTEVRPSWISNQKETTNPNTADQHQQQNEWNQEDFSIHGKNTIKHFNSITTEKWIRKGLRNRNNIKESAQTSLNGVLTLMDWIAKIPKYIIVKPIDRYLKKKTVGLSSNLSVPKRLKRTIKYGWGAAALWWTGLWRRLVPSAIAVSLTPNIIKQLWWGHHGLKWLFWLREKLHNNSTKKRWDMMNNFPLFAQEIQTSMNIPADSDTIPLYSTITTALLTSKLDKPNTTYFTENKNGDLIYFQTNLSKQTTCGMIKKNNIPDNMPSAIIGSVSYIDNNLRNSILSSTGVVSESFGKLPEKWSWYSNGQYELLLAQEREVIHKFFLNEPWKANQIKNNLNKAQEKIQKTATVSRQAGKEKRERLTKFDNYTDPTEMNRIFDIIDIGNTNTTINDLRELNRRWYLKSFRISKNDLNRHIEYNHPNNTTIHTHIIANNWSPRIWPRFDSATNSITLVTT